MSWQVGMDSNIMKMVSFIYQLLNFLYDLLTPKVIILAFALKLHLTLVLGTVLPLLGFRSGLNNIFFETFHFGHFGCLV